MAVAETGRPVRLVGVIDLRNGQAVHARGGNRHDYEPVAVALAPSIPRGDARGVTSFYRGRLRLDDIYVADLDAIHGRPWQTDLIGALAAMTPRLWLDAGITTVDDARRAQVLGASQIVVGLETLSSYAALRDICQAITGDRVAFSLDLRAGVPLTMAAMPAVTASSAAAAAMDSGATTVIVLDVARVGLEGGCDLEMLGAVRLAAPHVRLFAAGGVRDREDVRRLADVGCDGVLAATALLSGTLPVSNG